MSYKYLARVKASPGFWNRMLMKQINNETSFNIGKIKEDELIITSKNTIVIEEILKLSKEYPNEIFKVKIAGEDIFNNYVYLYEFSKGDSKLVNEGLEYCFGISHPELARLPEGLYEKFQKKVVDVFQRVEISDSNVIKLEIDSEEGDNASLTVLEVFYHTKNICLTAKKHGYTYIDVKAKFFNNPEIKISPEDGIEYKDYELPF